MLEAVKQNIVKLIKNLQSNPLSFDPWDRICARNYMMSSDSQVVLSKVPTFKK